MIFKHTFETVKQLVGILIFKKNVAIKITKMIGFVYKLFDLITGKV